MRTHTLAIVALAALMAWPAQAEECGEMFKMLGLMTGASFICNNDRRTVYLQQAMA